MFEIQTSFSMREKKLKTY